MSGNSSSNEPNAKAQLVKPSSSESENRAFTEALRKVLSVPRAEILSRIPPKQKRSGKQSSDSRSAKGRATGGASR
jgi:hypothetical protein